MDVRLPDRRPEAHSGEHKLWFATTAAHDGTLSNWRSQTLIRRSSVFHRQRWPASNSNDHQWQFHFSGRLCWSFEEATIRGRPLNAPNKLCFMLLVRKTRFLIRPCNGSYFNLKFRQIPPNSSKNFHKATLTWIRCLIEQGASGTFDISC